MNFAFSGEPSGNVTAPGSKSYSQRYILMSLLFGVPLTIHNFGYSEDELRAISIANQCGLDVVSRSGTIDMSGSMRTPEEVFVGESATLFRLSLGGFSGLRENIVFKLSESLFRRPHSQLIQAIESLGARFEWYGRRLRMDARTLRNGNVAITGNVSSQFISALILMKAVMDDYNSEIHVDGGASSAGYVDITADVLKRYGTQVSFKNGSYAVSPRAHVSHLEVTLEGDYSSAAFILVMGGVASESGVTIKGLRLGSLQPDIKILEILRQAGCYVSTGDGSVTVRKSALRGGVYDLDCCPDLALPVSVMAIFSEGDSVLNGISRLRYKESDRVEGIRELVSSFGGVATVMDDSIKISPPARVSAPDVLAFTEHRTVMAGIAASICAGSGTVNKNIERVSKSFPGFLSSLASLGINCREC